MATTRPLSHSLRTATLNDQTYIEHLQRQHTNALGFVPRAAITDHIARHNYTILTVNGQDAAYALHGGGLLRPYRLVQCAVTDELWRLGYGRALIEHALARARTRRYSDTVVTVRDRLLMNAVCLNLGATLTATTHPRTSRKLPLHHYRFVQTPTLFD